MADEDKAPETAAEWLAMLNKGRAAMGVGDVPTTDRVYKQLTTPADMVNNAGVLVPTDLWNRAVNDQPRGEGLTPQQLYTQAPPSNWAELLEYEYQHGGKHVVEAPYGLFYHRDEQGNWLPVGPQPKLDPEGGTAYLDPTTGTWRTLAGDKGGLFGLGPGWGSLVGAALVLGGGFGLGELATLAAAPAVVGAGEAAAAAAPEVAAAAAPEAAAASSGLLGTGVSASEALKAASLLNTLVRTGMNPSGGNIGGLVGGLAGSYFGVPGGATVGRLAGSELAQAAGGGDGGGDTPQQTSAGKNWGPLILAALLQNRGQGVTPQSQSVSLQRHGRGLTV